MTVDLEFMRLALREAKKGVGRTSPNPVVGAVVVKNGLVVGKGYHRKAGEPHAEINALADAGAAAADATIYVTLEPCNHTGRTSPCTKAILAAGIKRVVIGMADPNPIATGGADFLESQGLAVTRAVLVEECELINHPFTKHVTTGLPWLIMKAGMSLDGRIATHTGHSSWITNEQSRASVHRLRDRVDVILIGIGTALADDPSLTTRLAKGRGRDPLRVVLDTNLRLSPTAKMLLQESSAPTWIFCGPRPDAAKVKALEAAGAVVKPVVLADTGAVELSAVLRELGRNQLNSVLVEGGGQVHAGFLRQQLVDEVNLYVAPCFIGGDGMPVIGGLGVDTVQGTNRIKNMRIRRFGDDLFIQGCFN